MSTPSNQIEGYVTKASPKSPRASSDTNLVFSPGVVTNYSDRSIIGRWKDSNRVRWHNGQLEKIYGWEAQSLIGAVDADGKYTGTTRGTWDWASLDGQYWVAFGTECKLYLVNNGILYDITPLRKSSNVNNAFTTTNGQPVVLVTDPDHRANTGDHMTIVGTATVGGLTLTGPYDITQVFGPDTYEITASGNATSNATGGGQVTIEYDINCGLAENGFLFGYGTGEFGEGTYGTARSGSGNGVPAKMRIWSLQNFGEDLIASDSDGEIYWWDRSTGPGARAVLIADAPTSVQRVIVNPDLEFIVAVGASDLDGTIDKMNVRFCSEGDLQDWIPVLLPTPNTAGGQRLNYGSRMVTGVPTRAGNILWSDTMLYIMQFIGAPNIFGFQPQGETRIVGPNAAAAANGIVYWMAFDEFAVYDGTIRPLPCDVWEYVFNDFDRSQSEAVYAVHYETKHEVTWFYPAASVVETRYVTYNYMDACWYYGKMERTAYHDVSPALNGSYQFPFAFNDGILYLQETGLDEIEPAGVVNAMDYHATTWALGAQSDRPILINSIIPDFPYVDGEIQLKKGLQFVLLPREYPTQQENTASFPEKGPYVVVPDTDQINLRCNGTQTSMRIESARATWTDEHGTHTDAIVFGQWFRMGTWQSDGVPYGKRIGGSSKGSPIDTSGP